MAMISKPETKQNTFSEYDILIVGAGLAGLCLAYRIKATQPHLTIKIFDQQKMFIGDKTWSFHGKDVETLAPWQPFVTGSWDRYEVRFTRSQKIKQAYFTMSSHSFFQKMQTLLQKELLLATPIHSLTANSVFTEAGETYHGKVVVDARSSFPGSLRQMELAGWGFQKFLGLEIQTVKPHGLCEPIIMDAQVPQTDGYRFFYTLPLSERRLLIEDTYYSNSSALNRETSLRDLRLYAHDQGWTIAEEGRVEIGCLPIPTFQTIDPILPQSSQPLKIGAGAGFFHPVTGYSFLWSTRVAEALAQIPNPNPETYGRALQELHRQRKANEGFYLFLNRLMFLGSDERHRKNIFERFYSLPTSTIERFYAGRSRWIDRLRLLIGKPPIPISAALRVLLRGIPPHRQLLLKGEQR